jgi:hypothetical protein
MPVPPWQRSIKDLWPQTIAGVKSGAVLTVEKICTSAPPSNGVSLVPTSRALSKAL